MVRFNIRDLLGIGLTAKHWRIGAFLLESQFVRAGNKFNLRVTTDVKVFQTIGKDAKFRSFAFLPRHGGESCFVL